MDDPWDWDDGDELEPLDVDLRALEDVDLGWDEEAGVVDDAGVDDAPWRHEAMCRPTVGDADHLDAFFPSEPDQITPEADALCRWCPVLEPCYRHALYHEEWGIWGLTTEAERRVRRKQLGIRLVTYPPPPVDPPATEPEPDMEDD